MKLEPSQQFVVQYSLGLLASRNGFTIVITPTEKLPKWTWGKDLPTF